MSLTVELVSPEGILFEGEADMVVARTVGGGDIAFLSGHVPFIGSLAVSLVKVIQGGGREQLIAAHRGFVSVANDRVSVLSDVAELAEDIDVPRAERSKSAAEDTLRSHPDDEDAKAALRRAEVRLAAAQARRA